MTDLSACIKAGFRVCRSFIGLILAKFDPKLLKTGQNCQYPIFGHSNDLYLPQLVLMATDTYNRHMSIIISRFQDIDELFISEISQKTILDPPAPKLGIFGKIKELGNLLCPFHPQWLFLTIYNSNILYGSILSLVPWVCPEQEICEF